ncbi:MAG: UTP--glucose-1-phosphate uridylyltransferase [Verrucomicrobia bacterium]|nr:UTP--glucose-1-phosphate uridylyltransferase [Verrucomicrobiota bacterium]
MPIITATDPAIRNLSLDSLCQGASVRRLLQYCAELEEFRKDAPNLYERARALFFLYAIHRFHLPGKPGFKSRGFVSFKGYTHLLERRFEEAIDVFLEVQTKDGASEASSSALAATYHRLGFQTLADQVRRSVRSLRGNQWMFRIGHPSDQPLRIRPELLRKTDEDGTYPILRERTPVRMDLTHSAWSDIFFLGMDYPEGARVLNVSIDLAVRGRDTLPGPPIESFIRVIDEPVLRLTSVDLGVSADITELADVFDFAKDYLGLLKAAVIAAGIVPPGIEGSGQNLAELLARLAGPGRGVELVSNVHDIPKGSRLAVSTNLLAGLIAVCMRATGQTDSLDGELNEKDRRLVAARAILGEWLGGSGGGWQDSGGVWPGMKLIQGVLAQETDPEWGVSRGRLLPQHRVLARDEVSDTMRQRLQESLVLVHGGMAQNVGHILEMVTEKYLLRSAAEWQGRKTALTILDEILTALAAEDADAIGTATMRNFNGPIQTIIPWASNHYTELLIERTRAAFPEHFKGFWMLGGMAGGGMGFIFAPEKKREAQARLQEIMSAAKRDLEHALPFAMEPIVYDFTINERGTTARMLRHHDALLPPGYYALMVPKWLRAELRSMTPLRRAELDKFGAACRTKPELRGMVQVLFDRLLPRLDLSSTDGSNLTALLDENGFDALQHEQIRADLKGSRVGLPHNRLPPNTEIRDVKEREIVDATAELPADYLQLGSELIASGAVAVVTLAAGAGSRWTQGAGVVKALHPYAKLAGRHRTFIETHLAKSRRVSRIHGVPVPHVFTTSYLTHRPIREFLTRQANYGYAGPLHLSAGRAVGLRFVPMVRDLRFAWEEQAQQLLDEQAQKMRDSTRAALIDWARQSGEASDYTDNLPLQCLHPVGHWYEVPNLLRNGVLRELLQERPNLKHLLLHNIDTLGANLDATLLGLHASLGGALTFEMITRRIEDRGGGLAKVNGRIRLVEGLAMPREEDEFGLSYYNSMTTWIEIDGLLSAFELTRNDLADAEKIAGAIRHLAAKMPTYITLKDVKKRWGHGHEDVFPVAQFEKLWGDMTALPEVNCRFVVVPRLRGQQLKDQAQLDGWLRDGSAAHLESLCEWS